MASTIFVCEQHDRDVIICYSGVYCPMCELQNERDQIEADADYQESELNEAQAEIDSLKEQITKLEDAAEAKEQPDA